MLSTAEGQAGRWIAHSMVTCQLARGARLSFVYDFVSGKAAFSSLKYTLDAARKPLRTDLGDEDFTALYGISRRLAFKPAEPRKRWQQDAWTNVYA